jgi:hypothetical protein
MSAQVELWRVSTPEGVFETDLETLQQWITEGCVAKTDKVSKGNLNWIDAGRVPKLKGAFNGDPVVIPVVIAAQPQATAPPIEPEQAGERISHAVPSEPPQDVWAPTTQTSNSGAAPSNVCYNHPETPTKYLCRICSAALCGECPNYAGASKIPLCPLCGDLCKPYAEIRTKAVSLEFQSSGFGVSDFTRAIRYPLQHKTALVSGALIYGFLLIAGFYGSIAGYVIMFGCMSHVISQVAWGRLNRSFMPDFSEFNFMDDLVTPAFLGIGITIVTWGPVLVLLLALLFGILSGPGRAILGAPSPESAPQSSALSPEDLAVLMDPNADPKKLEEANKKLTQLQPGAQISEAAERSKKEQNDPAAGIRNLAPLLGAGMVVVLLLLVGLAWAIFYYPMALAVAGYTQSFASVINPLVGLDTIRRMGATYFKAFGMVLLIQVVALIVTVIVAKITAPLALPFVGNLPAKFIDGTVTFYFNLVIACVLGLSLYKCADRLDIAVD